MKKLGGLIFGVSATALLLAACGSDGSGGGSHGGKVTWPTDVVADAGDISMPEGFLDWPTLGAWSTADENGVTNGMHQVYITPGATAAYRKNGAFPDGTILVKEVRAASTANLPTGAASHATDKGVWFVMIKDATNRFGDHPLWGEGWGWAMFEAANPTKQVASDYTKDCLQCHVPAKDSDWIYVEAYPVLWPNGEPPVAKWVVAAGAAAGGAEGSGADGENGGEKQAAVAPEQFTQCTACHSAEEGKNSIGPSLAGVFGRKAGSAPDYAYSAAMTSSNITWDRGNLDKHIKDPSSVVPGNKMAALFPNGVSSKEDREAIINYLEAL